MAAMCRMHMAYTVYSPKHKNSHLAFEYHDVCMYVLCCNNCQVHWLLSTLTCLWLWIMYLFSHCSVVVKDVLLTM